ncbi:MAG: tetratricopeptide repeat protein [Clostridiales bacterium]|nr:tetratricopeptide repeat protein [Clostridiales bacterium]
MKLRHKILPLTLCVAMSISGCGLSSANQNYSKALAAYNKNDFTKAQDYFIKAIEANADKAEYHIDYGFTLLAMKEYDKAREQFRIVILDKNIPMVSENNKKAYRGIGISYLCDENYEMAIQNFDAALEIKELDSLNTDIMYYKASAFEKSGDNESAIKIYTSILESNPKDDQIYSARANQYRISKDYENCIADYDKAITLNPNEFDYYVGKFAALKENNKNAEATAVLEQAAALKISNEDDKYELAKVHFYQGNYELAMNELTQSIEAGYTEGYYFIGEINLMNRDYQTALDNFNRYLEDNNGASAMLYNQMLTCYLQLKDYDQAKKYLAKAKKYSDPGVKTQLLKNEIIYLEHMGQFEEALDLMEKYMKACPEDTDAQKDFYFLKTRTDALASQGESENSGEPTNPGEASDTTVSGSSKDTPTTGTTIVKP